MSTAAPYSFVYVYLRFSSEAQADGNSFDRQRESANERLSRLGLDVESVVWIEDPGLSAYKGSHLLTGELGKFLKKVRSGELRDGLFVCESVSRASRQGAFVLLTMMNDLLDAGFSILFLDQSEPFKKGNIPRFLAVQLTLLADLAQEESRIKSDFAKDNWAKRRSAARAKREDEDFVFTKECPGWLEVRDGAYVLIPDRAASIRTIFAHARDGWGISKLVREANTKKLASPGKSGTWHLSLIKRVLTNRAVIGEFQPHIDEGAKRVPEGDPIRGFYPVVIDEDLFFAVQGLRAKAATFPKRRDGNNFNFLQGLAKCECGGAWRRMNKNSGAQEGYALYGCSNRVRALTDCPNINARAFDFQFVGFACESIPDMLSSGENPLGERRQSLEAQLGEVAKKRLSVLDFIEEHPDLHAETAVRLRKLIAEQHKLSEQLLELDKQQSPPPGFSFGEAVDVFMPAYIDVFAPDTPEAEDAYRARALFRARIIEAVDSVWVSKDRGTLRLKLKNGAEAVLEIERDVEFGAVNDELSPAELKKLAKRRQLSIAEVHKMNNAKGRAAKRITEG